jgi:hypothetical protein
VLRGAVALDRERLVAGDRAAVSEEPKLEIRADQPSEILPFDLG